MSRLQWGLCKTPELLLWLWALLKEQQARMKGGGREADCKAASSQLYPKAPLALQGTTHTWLKLESAKEVIQSNGGESRPRWLRDRLQEERETAGARAKPPVWECGCPFVEVP